MKLNFNFLKEDVIYLNKIIVSNYLEPHGVENSNLDFAMDHIKDNYIKNDLEKLSFLIINVNNGHCFIEGNKRTSISLLLNILISNNFILFFKNFEKEVEELALDIAKNKYTKKTLAKFLSKHIIEIKSFKKKVNKFVKEIQKSKNNKDKYKKLYTTYLTSLKFYDDFLNKEGLI